MLILNFKVAIKKRGLLKNVIMVKPKKSLI